jgi:hypothetical protein
MPAWTIKAFFDGIEIVYGMNGVRTTTLVVK